MSSFSNLAICMIFRLKMQDLLWAAHTNCCVFARFVTQIPEHLGIPRNSQMVLSCILHDDIKTKQKNYPLLKQSVFHSELDFSKE